MFGPALPALARNREVIAVDLQGLIQSALIRLGFDPGPIDGLIGFRTNGALTAAGATLDNADTVLAGMIQSKFPGEFLQLIAAGGA